MKYGDRSAPPEATAATVSEPHFKLLLRSVGFSVGEFRCPGLPAHTEAECSLFPEIAIPRSGQYLRSDENGTVLLGKTVLAFFEAGKPYTIQHLQPQPDLTTVIAITDPNALHASLGVRLPAGRAFARSAVRMPLEVIVLHRRLLRDLSRGADSLLAAEETTANLILAALALNLAEAQELARLLPDSRNLAEIDHAHAEQVVRYLSSAFRERITLETVSREVGLSPFHLCRLFQAVMKTSIHQFVISLRLDASVAELLETDKSITEIALDAGFSSHSHFTALMSRALGKPPSVVRSEARTPQRRHTSER